MAGETTPNLKLPYILAAQSQKHVTHNEAIRALDALVHLAVLDRDLAAPPGAAADGDRYIVAGGASGEWTGQTANVAAMQDGAWAFLDPEEGWIAWVADENAAVVFDGAGWTSLGTGGGGGGLAGVIDDTTPQLGGQLDVNGFALGDGTLELLKFSEAASAANEVTIANAATGGNPAVSATGDDANITLALAGKGTGGVRAAVFGVNANADTTNRLSVTSPASLFNHAGAGHQVKVNKNATGDTASFLFQTNFSGRAEIGLTGDDDFRFKVSPDGSAFFDGIRIDRTTGRVSFPSGGARELLTANRTYYVRTDGNNSNTGLANTSAGAFLTIQKAIDVVAGLDLGIYNVTIQLADGTYTTPVVVPAAFPVGSGAVTILGNTGAPANVIVSTTNADAFMLAGCRLTVNGFEVRTTTAGDGFEVTAGAQLTLGTAMRFGACANRHMFITSYGVVYASAYTVSGGATQHVLIQGASMRVIGSSSVITVTGTPAFTTFMHCTTGYVVFFSVSFSGSATGQRYVTEANGVIATFGGGANYYPGNAAGSVATGGQYA